MQGNIEYFECIAYLKMMIASLESTHKKGENDYNIVMMKRVLVIVEGKLDNKNRANSEN